ncbi:uncharacterized protein LOC116291838, partial [Actinia tenebrosa]|uniref:Uncharacterized protein LOC116291838 n=1 Tax=Actinia tenebrosa TaxID=6105 RepID=A0A6P8HGF5_ACTTE
TKRGDWPRKIIAACKIICTDKDGKTWASHQIYRNDDENHAEENLIEYLRWLGHTLDASRIIIKVYINYSPCNECSEAILKYIKEMKSQKRESEMTITFANFYETHEYTYKKQDGTTGGNRKKKARENIEGLKKLYKYREPGVNLRLLGVHVKWERFLGMSKFFSLTEEEKDDCLDQACSNERQRREIQDQMVWDEIFNDGVEEITSGIDSL